VGSCGKDYDEVSFANSDALAHATQRLNARASERIPDVAIGTGCSARNVRASVTLGGKAAIDQPLLTHLDL
jgi:hypothetical protein